MKIKSCFTFILAVTRAALSTDGRAKSKSLAVLERNLVMTLLSNALRRAVRWGSNAVGIACLMITTAAGAGETWDTFASGARVDGPVQAVTTFGGDLIVGGQFGTAGPVPDTIGIAR